MNGRQLLTKISVAPFKILFKNKDDQFRSSAVDRPNG